MSAVYHEGQWWCSRPGGLVFANAWNQADAEFKCGGGPGGNTATIPRTEPRGGVVLPVTERPLFIGNPTPPPVTTDPDPPAPETPPVGDVLQFLGGLIDTLPDAPGAASLAPSPSPDDCPWCAASKRKLWPWLLWLLLAWGAWRVLK